MKSSPFMISESSSELWAKEIPDKKNKKKRIVLVFIKAYLGIKIKEKSALKRTLQVFEQEVLINNQLTSSNVIILVYKFNQEHPLHIFKINLN